MPFGTLNVNEATTVPLCSPPYSDGVISASKVTMVTLIYRVASNSVCRLVPDFLELEEEPRVTSRFIHYGASTVGTYSEFVQQVEVTYQGEKFDYNLILILDNEAAIFLGREKFGFAKVFGTINIQTSSGNRSYSGNAERLDKETCVEFDFVPRTAVQPDKSTPKNWMLNIRNVPSPLAGAAPSIRELVPVTMDMEFSSMWLGTGSINFPKDSSGEDLWSNVDILRYEGAFLVENAQANLYARERSSL